jgi:hypothetical protein
MKKLPISPLVCYLICLFVFCFLACGGGEDVEPGATNPLNPTDTSTDSIEDLDPFILRVESTYTQLNEGKIDVPRNWEEVEDPVLRAAYARFLLSTGKLALPRHWIHTEDRILFAEYYRAQLVKQFGDIPQVHTVANMELKDAIGAAMGIPWFRVKPGERLAHFEALYHLWPTENNRLALENARKDAAKPTYVELRKKNPERWAQLEREQLIEEHGDNPHTHIVAEFHRKIALGLHTTEDEYLTYLEAQVHLNPDDEIGARLLERFRRAKADGIPFEDVKTDDIVPPK